MICDNATLTDVFVARHTHYCCKVVNIILWYIITDEHNGDTHIT
jgi:hypothetical protein